MKFNQLKKHKILVLKILITVTVLSFTIVSIINIIFMCSKQKFFNALFLLYLLVLILCTYVVEISPYLLYKYISQVFPPIKKYSGRMWPYIIAGLIFMCPELNLDELYNDPKVRGFMLNQTSITNETEIFNENITDVNEESEKVNLGLFLFDDFFDYSFIVGIAMIIIGLLCFLMDKTLSTHQKIQENQLLVMSKNYEDFNYSNSIRESYNIKGLSPTNDFVGYNYNKNRRKESSPDTIAKLNTLKKFEKKSKDMNIIELEDK